MMRAVITTSWDDGHPLDLRLADMLADHGLRATFYVPGRCDRPVMSAAELRRLAGAFEIGAHTLDHRPLTALPPAEAQRQIAESRQWLEDALGRPCAVICPPLGRFTAAHVEMMRRAGFRGYRTVELLSLDSPRPRGGIYEMPTSVQAFGHGPATYLRNAIRRFRADNLLRYWLCGGGSWLDILRGLVHHAASRGGVIHLWGHSWEIEENALWNDLRQAMRILEDALATMTAATNGQLVTAPQ